MQLSDRLQYIQQEIILPESFVSRRFPTLHNVRPFYYNQDLSNHQNCSVLYSTSLIFAASPIQNEDCTVKPEILPPSVVLWKYRIDIVLYTVYRVTALGRCTKGGNHMDYNGHQPLIRVNNRNKLKITSYVGSTW